MNYPFRNLIFEGGGVKGIAYVGAFQVLEEQGIIKDTRRVGGTSAGAINAVLLALGYTLKETRDILMDLDFNNFMDDTWGLYRDSKRLISEFGWYKGDFFKGWIGDRIREKTKNENSTFLELKNQNYLDLYLVGTNLSTGYSEVFSAEHTPRMRIVDAVRISMSIPLFFAAVRNLRSDIYVDGGLFNNYPIKLFDREKYIPRTDLPRHARRPDYYQKENATKPETSSEYVYNKETLGFRLDSGRDIAVFRDHAEPRHLELNDFFDYLLALFRSTLKVQESIHLHSDDWHRTIYINTLGVGTTDFDLTAAKKEELILEGHQAAKKYLEWFKANPPQDRPRNHPDNQD
ncbi:MAG: patatin-like phospholipase family protein [Desulfohalobiaceae bacterium]|nr:patatin-like phospholipase family protein [Desulfohalobiaceae bacterium]MCF8106189.1 patatin-like phospholipase family protein [Desulfohalobiaceae bacterium]